MAGAEVWVGELSMANDGLGLLLIFLGIAFIVVGAFLLSGGEVKAGGVIMLGPIPIPFGDARLALLGALFGLLLLLATLLWRA